MVSSFYYHIRYSGVLVAADWFSQIQRLLNHRLSGLRPQTPGEFAIGVDWAEACDSLFFLSFCLSWFSFSFNATPPTEHHALLKHVVCLQDQWQCSLFDPTVVEGFTRFYFGTALWLANLMSPLVTLSKVNCHCFVVATES